MSQLGARLSGLTSTVLSLFRIVFGLLFFVHGTSKLFGWPVGPTVPSGSQFWWAGILEITLGALITVGLFTRAAAFIAAGQMAVAFFTQHFPHGFWPIANQGEPAVLFCWAFFLLVFTGSGWLAIDSVLARRHKADKVDAPPVERA